MFKIKITTYEQDRLNYFEHLMDKANKRYNRLYARFKDAPYLSAEARALSDAGREISFLADCVEMLKNGYRKQEWISVADRLPEDVYDKDRKIITVLVCTKSGRVSTSSRVRMMMLNKEKRDFEYTDIFEWSGQIAKKITHWMPLPEPPKMKGGE